ncbi:MAG: EAL domain-containing protein [Methylotenera sp.]|nr:EAL domain-containing protein [Methylotenera sp.]
MKNLDKESYEKALQQCANEPIHQIGTIQPHGASLVLSSDLPRTILQFTTNLSNILGFSSSVTSGSTIVDVMGEVAANDVEQLIQISKKHQTATGKVGLRQSHGLLNLQAHLYNSEGTFVLELEHDDSSDQTHNLSHLFLNMQKQLLSFGVEKDVTSYFNQIAKLLRELMAYDSVMVYRFDSNWNGEVIAQDSIEAAPSYLGIHFPCSDIPPQARRLYTLNLVRLITDINATPIPFFPLLNPINQQPLDMTHSVLRSLSPVHLEYLRNMGVNASMTISIMQNDRLWGLITCHHFSPKHVSIHKREAALFIGQMASTQLASIEASERLSQIDRTEQVISKLLCTLHSVALADVLKNLLPDLQKLLNSTGVICLVEGRFYQYGEALEPSETQELITWINRQPIDEVFSTNHLSLDFDLAMNNKHLAAGVVVAQLTSDMNNCIIWLRKEKLRTIQWAGKYEEGFHQDIGGDYKLSPRKSFAIWSELLLGQSDVWSKADLLTAKSLARSLNETFAKKSRHESRRAEQKLIDAEMRIAATAFESQEGMMVTNSKNVILRVNHAFTQITGYSAEDVIGKTPKLLSSGQQDKHFYAAMWESIKYTGVWEGEIWNRRKSGEVYPEHLSITAVKDEDGIVTNYVATLTDITLSKAASDEIQNLAFYDPLTQLPNRRLLIDRLKQALAASARSGQRGAILFLDLDHFKALNDTLGHDVGDLLLKQVSQRLVNSVREGDTVARFGGDEFVVLLEDLSDQTLEAAKQTETIAEKIIAALNQPYLLGAHEHHSTPSMGASVFNDHAAEVDTILKQADIAMYQAKDSGRNTLRFFDPKMQEVISSRANLEHELRKAIEQQQFELYYQIQVDNTNSAIGAEALIRWHHPERGMISPYDFITLAEETGLIIPIGRWVLESACAQLKLWKQNPLTRDLMLSINVSAKQFFQSDFVELVQATLLQHEVDPKRFKIELTETMLVENIHDIIIKMDKLSKIGIRFSLDDFGTGYSSLQYLKKLPLNQLKIDQSFVRDIVTDASDRAIVRTIIIMAHSLDINVIAEGVETAEQKQYLLDNDCKHYQGYLFSKPIPIDEFEALLRKI